MSPWETCRRQCSNPGDFNRKSLLLICSLDREVYDLNPAGFSDSLLSTLWEEVSTLYRTVFQQPANRWNNLTHLIIIRYNRSTFENLPQSIINKFDSFETVWTDRSPGQFIDNPNECFEFSGYQEGLARVLQCIRSKGNLCKNSNHSILFANDTMFTGHSSLLVGFLFKRFLNMGMQKMYSEPKLTGLSGGDSRLYTNTTLPSGYISTWLFMLEGTYDQLSEVRFYDAEVIMENFIDKKFSKLPISYRQSVDEWLQHTNFFRGWYQSVPGHKLQASTLDRKRFTIYLEHSLPVRLRQSGFVMYDISRGGGALNNALLILLRFTDRCYVNFIKLRFRLCALIRN